MRTRVSIRSQCIILAFGGELGDCDAPAVQQAIRGQLGAWTGALVCDLEEVTALRPAAATVLTAASQELGAPERLVVLCNARPAVAEVLVRHSPAAAPPVCQALDDALLYIAARLPVTGDPNVDTLWPAAPPWWRPGDPPGTPGAPRLRITQTFQPLGLRLEGEVDFTNTIALAAALTETLAAGRDVRLDLSHVRSIDVEGLRLLARTAADLPRDRSLLLDPVPWHLRKMLCMSGWDMTPSLRLDAAIR